MEQNNRVDEVIELWTAVIFGEKMNVSELSNSPRLLELNYHQYFRLDTLLSTQFCALGTGVRFCPHCPRDTESLLQCRLVVRYLKEEIEEQRKNAHDAPEHVRQAIERRIIEVMDILHRYIESTQANIDPRTQADQYQTR
jgi:hypothetical protein